MRTNHYVAGEQPADAPWRPRRSLVLRAALLASASVVLLGVVAGCVQSPVANPAPMVLTDAEATAGAYLPDVVPLVVPSLGSAPDVSTPGEEPTSESTDPGTEPTMSLPTTSKVGTGAPAAQSTQGAPQAAGPAQPQATQAVTTTAPTTTAPTVAPTTAAKTTTAGTQALVGPGRVELTCTSSSNGKTKAVLKWDNPGFNASVIVNGKTFTLANTKGTSLTAFATEVTDGHGMCTGRVGDLPAASSY